MSLQRKLRSIAYDKWAVIVEVKENEIINSEIDDQIEYKDKRNK